MSVCNHLMTVSYFSQAGVSPLLQNQFEELARQKLGDIMNSGEGKRGNLLVIGQDRVEPLQALRNANHEVTLRILYAFLSCYFSIFHWTQTWVLVN